MDEILTNPFAQGVQEQTEMSIPDFGGTIQEEVPQTVSLLTTTSFQPDSNGIICQITPAKFDSLLKVLNVLVSEKSSNDSLVIKESNVTQNVSGAIISANIEDVFDGKKIDLQIINPKKYIKLFRTFKNNNDIFIIDDPENSRFIITNGEIKLFLPKQVENLVESVKLPDLSEYEGVCSVKVDKSVRNIIVGLASDAQYIDFLLQDNLLKAVYVPDTAIYLFNDYAKDAKAAKLDETNADLALRSTAAFSIPAEDYEISIGKHTDGSYVSATSCNTGFIKINVIESLEVATGGNLLI
jgi:hypothetical protein